MECGGYASQDAPRERRPSARGFLGNVVLLGGSSGVAVVGIAGYAVRWWVRGSAGSGGHSFIPIFNFMAVLNLCELQ